MLIIVNIIVVVVIIIILMQSPLTLYSAKAIIVPH